MKAFVKAGGFGSKEDIDISDEAYAALGQFNARESTYMRRAIVQHVKHARESGEKWDAETVTAFASGIIRN